jgi:uncharacterized protein (TIGR01777 family)
MTSPLLWALIALQIAMGAFDTLYHHELNERLAWRASQRHELRLHAGRNALYALLFLALGLTEPHGFWATLVMAVLAVEVVITLIDFIEEDMTRRLPASERVNHTLLALNYGAILVLLLPVLIDWAADKTSIRPALHGVWSVLATLAAVAVALFAWRDFYAARRCDRLLPGPAEKLTGVLARRHCVLVTGATGFIGRRLVEALAIGGHEVIVLARAGRSLAALRPPFRLVTSLDQLPNTTRIDAIVNLAGEPIADGLWTRAKRRRILRSRLRVTRDAVHLIARLDQRPAVLISGSAVGWYGLRADERLTETSDGAACFTHDVCEAWENAASEAERYGVRVVRLRMGLVLGVQGGLLGRLLTPFDLGLGGPIGRGEQWMSWIERDDLVRLIVHCMTTVDLSGPVNAVAPHPVRNVRFAQELGRVLHRPALLRAPAALLHLLGGAFADELLLGGQRVLPQKAQASGFRFRHPTLRGALCEILGVANAGPDRRPGGALVASRTLLQWIEPDPRNTQTN